MHSSPSEAADSPSRTRRSVMKRQAFPILRLSLVRSRLRARAALLSLSLCFCLNYYTRLVEMGVLAVDAHVSGSHRGITLPDCFPGRLTLA